MLKMTARLMIVIAGAGLGLWPVATGRHESAVHDQHPTTARAQIRWQRSLDDALAVSRAEGRPILIAVNMDGESASDRIVHEMYRDPGFVESTNRCVCLAASLFRHNPRDYDDSGRRIPCPRLGEVTCAEHIALEPLLFEKFLSDGDRVAPRHALIRADGAKALDTSLSFDLRDVQRELDRALSAIGPTPSKDPAADGALSPTAGDDTSPIATLMTPAMWQRMAGLRSEGGRSALEARVSDAHDPFTVDAALDALATHGDAGGLGALRILCARLAQLPLDVRQHMVATTRKLGLEGDVATVLREQISGLGPFPGSLGVADTGGNLVTMAMLAPDSESGRALVLATAAVASRTVEADAALEFAFDAHTRSDVRRAIDQHGGPVSLRDVLDLTHSTTMALRAGAGTRVTTSPRPGPITDAMADAEGLRKAIEDSRSAVAAPDCPAETLWRYAKSCLDLGRRSREADAADADQLLTDAESAFDRALAMKPDQAAWWIERARAAYFRGAFSDEATFGYQALRLVSSLATGALPHEGEILGAARAQPAAAPRSTNLAELLDDGIAIEALRWIGDGEVRVLTSGRKHDPYAIAGHSISALRALSIVAASPFADANDWIALGSFLETNNLRREALAVLCEAGRRLPESAEVRDQLNALLATSGRIELAPAFAERIALEAPHSPVAAFQAGYAWMLAAESLRRTEQPELAALAYARAEAALMRSAGLEGSDRERCGLFAGLCRFGTGMAVLQRDFVAGTGGRLRERAADELVAGVRASLAAASGHDGMGCDVFDLVDRIFEWRELGPSRIDPERLLDNLADAGSKDGFFPRAVADSLLREALRADGRNPDRQMRATVDASGKGITMPMGRPTADGDGYLTAAIAAARRAMKVEDTDESRRLLANCVTIIAERSLEIGNIERVRASLTEAAPLMAVDRPAPDASLETLKATAAKLRALLGDARPRFRPNR